MLCKIKGTQKRKHIKASYIYQLKLNGSYLLERALGGVY
jgi:hypothetical protein